MTSARQIDIVGGGLAGLSLGLALARRGVPVKVSEAGDYPRHRVCGEFIAGLQSSTVNTLGLAEMLRDAVEHRTVGWYARGRRLAGHTLRVPARGISRYALDARLAEAFTRAGGQLALGTRVAVDEPQEGRVHTQGRRRATPSPWLGLKAHARGITLQNDLEVHLGERAYVGLCRVENGAVNVCGLFRRRPGLTLDRGSALAEYLRGSNLRAVAERIEQAQIDPASQCAVAGLTFEAAPPEPGFPRLGDARVMIPPFTGNGMAIAFQSAELALGPLAEWAARGISWEEASRRVEAGVEKRFHRRLALAAALHPFLLAPGLQSLFRVFNRARLLPMRSIAGAVHA